MNIDNLGISPLAGLCTYEEAQRPGIGVERNVELLRRYNFVMSRLNLVLAAHLPATPEWEVKGAISLHLWLDAEHATSLRSRISEMREPPLHLDQVPDDRLEALMEEVIRAGSTLELLVGVYRVVRGDLVQSLRKHLADTNPLADHPTRRALRLILLEEEETLTWGETAISALSRSAADGQTVLAFEKHLRAFLEAAGGLYGDLHPSGQALPTARWDGAPYQMDVVPRRDARFRDPFNRAARVDDYYTDDSLPFEERVMAMMCKRLREMDVPEWMGPILFKTSGKPWEYYRDVSRQLWDEARHAMMGEVGFIRGQVPFYRYPVDFRTSNALNLEFSPLEAHTVLWAIEQSQMPRKTGKRYEWTIARDGKDNLAVTFQDYDWADEVLHAQIGRRWLEADYENAEAMRNAGSAIQERLVAVMERLAERSAQVPWWPALLDDLRSGSPELEAVR